MKTLLAAVNAKFIHTNIAVRSIREYSLLRGIKNIDFIEFTINQYTDFAAEKIYGLKPDVLIFSCYIWNIRFVIETAELISLTLPDTKIYLGGPEVSFDSVEYIKKYPFINGIIRGEGEETIYELLKNNTDPFGIAGITWRNGGKIIENPSRIPLCDMDALPFPYSEEEMPELKNKLIYYESSRGCPFGCSYCLSSTDMGVRYRSLDRVKEELMFFIKHKVRTVKFVDRTFNADPRRTAQLLDFLRKNGGDTTFHLEVAADILTSNVIDILNSAPKGRFQLEIGVQSTYLPALSAVGRKADFDRISDAVKKLMPSVHLHLDLIAGLPMEDLERFAQSFDEVFDLRPDELQLGFLKMLKGTRIREESGKYGFKFAPFPPYEVLSNDFMSHDDILHLKHVEDVLEKYYNSGSFRHSLEYLLKDKGGFDFFSELGQWFYSKGFFDMPHSRKELFSLLAEFGGADPLFREYLRLDFIENHVSGTNPEWRAQMPYRDIPRFQTLTKEFVSEYLPQYSELPAKEIIKHVRFEWFCRNVLSNGEAGEFLIMFSEQGSVLVKS